MTESENTEEVQEFIPTVEKQLFLANSVSFTVISEKPRHSWKTNYAYYLKQKGSGGPVRPLIGRETEDGKFQIYQDGTWIDKNLWDNYSEPITDGDGNITKNANGKPKKRLLFDHKHDWIVKFTEPVPVEYWDPEQKEVVSEKIEKFYIRLSQNLSGKLKEQIDDKRNNKDTLYTVEYDPTKSPAEQYKVKYHSQPE